jgi:hypothetical protein
MAYELTSTQARVVSTTDLVIYNEVDTISRAIMASALAGNLNTTVDDGTTITQSTPTITVTGTEINPVVGGVNESLTLAGETVILLANADIDQIVAAINDAAITGLTATKNATGQVVIAYDPPQANWVLVIGADSGNATVGFTASNVAALTPDSVDYHSVWIGTTVDRKKSYVYSQVVAHFLGLGYSIIAKQNTVTANTILWEIYW